MKFINEDLRKKKAGAGKKRRVTRMYYPSNRLNSFTVDLFMPPLSLPGQQPRSGV